MQLGSVRALKQELDERLRRRSALMEKISYVVSGLGDTYVQEMFRPPLARGISRIGPRDYGLAVRVYAGKDALAREVLKALSRYQHEVQVVRGVQYRPRALVAETILTAGSSIGHYKVTAGTLGGFVRDREGVYILSNNHVLANSNKAEGPDPILLPGPADNPNAGLRRSGRA